MRLKIQGLETEPIVKKTVNGLLSGQFRNRRYALHKYYEKFESDEMARENRPAKVTKEQWDDLCDYWSKDVVKVRLLIYNFYCHCLYNNLYSL